VSIVARTRRTFSILGANASGRSFAVISGLKRVAPLMDVMKMQPLGKNPCSLATSKRDFLPPLYGQA
jgi:hypothetical protein